MHTPTDPYNSANRRPFEDDDEVLAPIEEVSDHAENSETSGLDRGESGVLEYGDAEALAWDKVFTAQSAAVASETDEPVSAQEDTIDSFTADSNALTENAAVAPSVTENAASEKLATSANSPSSHNDFSFGEGFNTLPAEQRANAGLGDVLSAHSADEARYDATQDEFVPGFVASGSAENIGIGASGAPAVAAAGALGAVGATAPQAAPAVSTQQTSLGGFMHPGISADDDAQRRARWEQGPSAYLNDEDIDLEAPGGRAWTHVGIFFLTLLLIPITWYLLSDASVRLNLVENNPWDTGVVSFAAILELFGGLVGMLLLILLARASSLGAQIFGFILTVGGMAALIVPNTVKSWFTDLDQAIGDFNAFTANVVHHLDLDFGSGRIAIFGLVLLASGLTAHFARRSGAERATIYERRKALGLDE
ncbi:hypothetical protein [Arcanobacterium hippocoleae]|uniref:hypothetical protein n=1 Tax=Arcanobacterium hippocoleae TaxID=149017 RepID=UPI003341DDF6